MKKFLTTLQLVLGLMLCGQYHAQSWQTVDDYQFAPGTNTAGVFITTDAAGNLVSINNATVSNVTHTMLRRSTDHGITWHIMADLTTFRPAQIVYLPAGKAFAIGRTGSFYWQVAKSTNGGISWFVVDTFRGVASSPLAVAMAIDQAGRIFVVGRGEDLNRWFVRRSTNDGESWTTVDFFPAIEGSATASGVAISPSAVIVSGRSLSGWTVRRSADHGNTWKTVDLYERVPYFTAYGNGATVDSDGNFYVVGSVSEQVVGGSPGESEGHWVVRKSSDGGLTWKTVDDFVPRPGRSAIGMSIVADPNGHLFASGYAFDGTSAKWFVRRSGKGGISWTTTDEFYFVPTSRSVAGRSVILDPFGNVFVAGNVTDESGAAHSIVRKLPGPPPVHISRELARVRVRWPTSASIFVLESVPRLKSNALWQTVPGTVSQSDGEYWMILDNTNAAAFFRLRRP